MKDNITRALITGYLRNVKHCTVVQQSWTTSKYWPWNSSYKRLKKEYDYMKLNKIWKPILPASFSNIFDALKIDLLGVTSAKKVYAVFNFCENIHDSQSSTCSNNIKPEGIAASMISAYFALMLHFPVYRYRILFLSPLLHRNTEEELSWLIHKLNSELGSRHMVFKILVNDKFYDEISEKPLNIT